MANLDLLIKAWDTACWEFSLVFEGLADEDVWKRPDPRLLSVGELAGHLAHWEAVGLTPPEPGGEVDMEKVSIKSPLVDSAFRYYTTSVEEPVTRPLGAGQVLKEFQRVHEEAKAVLTKGPPDSEDVLAGTEK